MRGEGRARSATVTPYPIRPSPTAHHTLNLQSRCQSESQWSLLGGDSTSPLPPIHTHTHTGVRTHSQPSPDSPSKPLPHHAQASIRQSIRGGLQSKGRVCNLARHCLPIHGFRGEAKVSSFIANRNSPAPIHDSLFHVSLCSGLFPRGMPRKPRALELLLSASPSIFNSSISARSTVIIPSTTSIPPR